MKSITKRRLFSLLLAIIILFASLPVTATDTNSAYADDVFIYSDFDWVWIYEGSFRVVIIPEGTTRLYFDSFKNWEIDMIYIPLSVEKIDSGAFYRCDLGKVCYEGSYEQWNMIDIGGLYSEIYDQTDCVPNESLKYASKYYNSGIYNDEYIYYETGSIKQNNLSILLAAYLGTAPDVTLPERIHSLPVTLGSDAFRNNTTLKSVTIPEGYTSIGSSAFEDCINLTSVIFPSTTLSAISAAAFKNCAKLKTIELPSTITLIGENAFAGTGFYNNQKNWSDGLLYNGNYLLKSNADCYRANIKEGTTLVAAYAFNGCTNLLTVVFPKTMKYINASAFYNCTSIHSIVLHPGIESVGNSAFPSQLRWVLFTGTQSEWYPMLSAFPSNSSVRTAEYTFNYDIIPKKYKCVTADGAATLIDFSGTEEKLTLPEYVKDGSGGVFLLRTIGIKAFANCKNLKEIDFSYRTVNVESNAFLGCTSLESVKITAVTKSIASNAFEGCTSLSVIYYEGTRAQWESMNVTLNKKVRVVYNYNTSLEDFDFTIDESSKTVKITEYLGNNANIVIPATYKDYKVTSIANNAFSNNSVIESVTIIGSALEIGDYAFAGCPKLKTVIIKDGVYCIWSNAFEGCPSLKNIILPSSLSFIEYKAFYNCKSIDSVVFCGTSEQWSLFKEEIDRGNDPIIDPAILSLAKTTADNIMISPYEAADVISTENTIGEIYGYYTDEAICYRVIAPEGAVVYIPVSEDFAISDHTAFAIDNEGKAVSIELELIGTYLVFSASKDGTYAIVESIGTPGDINDDGAINAQDSNILKRYLSGNIDDSEIYLYDVNGDRLVTGIDSNLLKQILAGTFKLSN